MALNARFTALTVFKPSEWFSFPVCLLNFPAKTIRLLYGLRVVSKVRQRVVDLTDPQILAIIQAGYRLLHASRIRTIRLSEQLLLIKSYPVILMKDGNIGDTQSYPAR
ncbi:MAG: hypothetical protein H6974_07565 [Gammaproteobacteria bacterium]|nr:hypothetical protein [Gammaproteobacteria bacterium]MCP5196628.1 hypothetical protein [Gammaproteobacteria bacterium]